MLILFFTPECGLGDNKCSQTLLILTTTMKVYVKLEVNTEYHAYDIFKGVYASLKDAIDSEMFYWASLEVDYISYTHKDDEDEDEDENYNPTHTHVIFFNKDFGTPTKEEVKDAVENLHENSIKEYVILDTIVIIEKTI